MKKIEKDLDIDLELLYTLDNIFEKYKEVKCVKVFGSRAKGKNRPNSDIDLAIFSDNTSLIDLYFEINELDTLISFDIIFVSDDINDKLLQEIEKYGVVIYERI